MSLLPSHRIAKPALHLAAGLALTLGAAALVPETAHAFCGFYVSGGTTELFNNATQVVLMREGTKTILSMQNNYQGPTQDFAMVVPVPVVLQQQNVKTLPPELFKKVDTLSAPRLVEYWEIDPCAPMDVYPDSLSGVPERASDDGGSDSGSGVKVEAQFEVGEYQVVVLSASEATGLETWLKDNAYNIPSGAAPLFQQYIQQGQYFFVAKVDPKKVTFKDGRAVLSPLRFDYDSPAFSLPVRMGMVNSKGEQDLIVYVLSREGRFEVANYPNVTIPTNIEVSPDVRKDFPVFFTKLFTATLQKHPNAVVTEYSWDASTCDPCPGPTMDAADYATLGADVLADTDAFGGWGSGWTLTRLHARYGKAGLADDLVFRKAPSIVGGREVYDGKRLETGAKPDQGANNFQGRYIMRNRWSGPITCATPVFGRWGGPPDDEQAVTRARTSLSPNSSDVTEEAAKQSVLAQRSLASLVAQDVPELGVKPQKATSGGCSFADGAAASGSALSMLAALALLLRRRRDR